MYVHLSACRQSSPTVLEASCDLFKSFHPSRTACSHRCVVLESSRFCCLPFKMSVYSSFLSFLHVPSFLIPAFASLRLCLARSAPLSSLSIFSRLCSCTYLFLNELYSFVVAAIDYIAALLLALALCVLTDVPFPPFLNAYLLFLSFPPIFPLLLQLFLWLGVLLFAAGLK